MSFTPRLTIPEKGNPYYNTPAYLGYNPGKPAKGRATPGLTALPNCVSWAEGRFNEIAGTKAIKYLGPLAYYPYAMIGKAKQQGLKISQEPTLGGMLVWTGGLTGEGHVAICEVRTIKAGKVASIVSSDSEYYGEAFKTFKRTPGSDGNWAGECTWMTSAKKKGKPYIYQGCIVNPAVEEEMDYKDFEKYADKYMKEHIDKIMANYIAELAKKPASSKYAVEALTYLKSEGIMSGDKKGNTMPQKFLTREEYAIMEYNQAKKNGD